MSCCLAPETHKHGTFIMSTKLSLFSRAAADAGVLALTLPAFAQTNQPAATPAPASSPAPAAEKGAVKQSSTEHKTMKT